LTKKIIFWLDAELLRFGIAKELKENFECDLFSIIDITDKPKKFFETQNILKFKKKWFYHDHIKKLKQIIDIGYLRKFEDKYKINLWTLAFNERIFYQFNEFYKFSDSEILSILEQECKFFEKILDEVKPDYVILPNPSFHHYYLFYLMCKKKNVKTLVLQGTRLGNKCIIVDNIESIGYENFHAVKKRSLLELQDYKNQFSIYNQSRQFRERFLSSKTKLLKAGIEFLTSNNSNVKTHYTYYGRTKGKVLSNYILSSLRKKYRKQFIDKNLLKTYNFKKPFIFFTLHMEQEHSLLNVAPFYTNQIEVIKNIVKSLPIGYDLVIKEHPSMVSREWRKISDYNLLMSLPNVKVIHPNESPENFLKKCSLIITISGTSAFEGIFYLKPSIIFSDTPFSSLPSVHRIKSFEDLPSMIRKLLPSKISTEELNNYIEFVDKNAFDFDHHSFVQDYQDFFHHGGFLVDVEILEEKMKDFLQKNKFIFEKLAIEHIKKLKY